MEISEKAEEAEHDKVQEIITSLANTYEAFYYCNLDDGTYVRIDTHTETHKMIKLSGDFYPAICKIADKGIAEEHREMVKNLMTPENIYNELKDKDSFEFEYIRITGKKQKWMRGEVVSTSRHEDGNPFRYRYTVTDIDVHKRLDLAERQKNQAQAALLNIAFRNSNIYEFTYFIPERYIICSQRTCDAYGCKERYDNMPAGFREEFVHPDYYDVFNEMYEKCHAGVKKTYAEFKDKSKKRCCKVTLEITQYDEQGNPLLAVGIVENTDALHQARNQAATMQELCQFAVSCHYEGIRLINVKENSYSILNPNDEEEEDWKHVFVAEPYDDMIRDTMKKSAVGRCGKKAVESLLLENLVPVLKREGEYSVRYQLRTPEGPRWKLVECTFFRRNKKKIIMLTTDVQEEELAKERLQDALENAQAANKAKSAFLANMSHEIRTPMNAIVGMSEILLGKQLPTEILNDISTIQNAGAGLLAIINDILDFSKIEAGKLEVIPVDYMLPSLLMDISNMISVRLTDKPVYFLMNVDPNLPNHFVGDDIRVKQILMNLIGNAVKFTKEGFIELRVEGEAINDTTYQVTFKIIDSGIGIKEEDLGKLFGTFSQVDTKKNRAITGSGLGLAICKRLSEAMGGDISVESTYGKGTTFTVNILQQVKRYEPIGKVDKTGIKVLVCENDEVIISSVGRTLEKLNVEYRVCREMDKIRAYEDMTHVIIRRSRFVKVREKLEFMFERNNIYLVLENGEHSESQYMQYKQLQLPLIGLQIINAINDEEIISSIKKKNFDRSQIIPLTYAHVLIVDDNTTNLQVAMGLMAPYKMKIDTATSGFKALDMIRNVKYDAIFMDHMMPEMDGVETTRYIRSMEGDYFKKVPIIALTANAMSGAKNMFLKVGMDDFLAKPIEMTELHRIIKQYVQSKAPTGYLEKHLSKKAGENISPEQNKQMPAAASFTQGGPLIAGGNQDMLSQLLVQNNTLLSQNMLLLQQLFGAQPEIKPGTQQTMDEQLAENAQETSEIKEENNGWETEDQESEETEEKDSGADTLGDVIPKVNMAKALEMYNGSAEIYHGILKTYYFDIAEREAALEKIFEEKDIEKFTIFVHAIKSASKSVGADVLGELAYQLEQDGQKEDWASIEENFETFMKELHQMVFNVGAYVKQYVLSEEEKQEKQHAEAFAPDIVEAIKNACEDMDYLLVEEYLQKLAQYEYPEAKAVMLETMMRYCSEFEYEELEALIKGL